MSSIPVGSALYNRLTTWLYEEAHLLDANRYGDWLGLMTVDLAYRMPVRQALLARDGDGYDENTGFFVETYASLKTRVDRLATDQAWSDQPKSRTRHLISNILAYRDGDGFAIKSAFLVTRIRSDQPYDFFSGERHDLVRETDDGLRLARRTILLDQTILKAHNLSIFF